ncbi:hypothetical protein HKX48_004285, partial [Thoreauomyces humboldtii]
MSIPSSTPGYVLSQATDAQALQTIALHHLAFAPQLTAEGYLEREVSLRETRFAKDHLTTWVLTASNSSEILCSCETYTHDVVLKSPDGIRQGKCLAIASVYTAPKHRRKGFCGSMIEMLRDQHLGGTIASTLYSDIGPLYYANKGWDVLPSVSAVMTVGVEAPNAASLASDVVISRENLVPFVARSRESLIAHVEGAALSTVAVLPTVHKILWFAKRAEIYARLLSLPISSEMLATLGVHHEDQFVLWYPDLAEKKLYILHVHNPSRRDVRVMAEASIAYAGECGCETVIVWDPDWSGWETKDMRKETRKDSLSSLRIVDARPDVACHLAANEKYA